MEDIIGITARKINEMLNVEDLFDILMISPDNVLKENGKLRIHCPIHEDKVIHSLTIDPVSNTYRCTFSQCKGTRGGDLLDLYCEATGNTLKESIKFWAKRLGLPQETLAQLENSTDSNAMASASETKIERTKEKHSDTESIGSSNSSTATLEPPKPVSVAKDSPKVPQGKTPRSAFIAKEESNTEPLKPADSANDSLTPPVDRSPRSAFMSRQEPKTELQKPAAGVKDSPMPPLEKSPRSVFASKQESKIVAPKPVIANVSPKPVIQESKLQNIKKEGHVMDITKKSNSAEVPFYEIVERLKDIEPDWYRQYRLQDAIYMAQGARSEAIVRAQAEALTEYWDKHSQNIKAYQQNSFSLDEFQEFERQLIETKRKKMNQSYMTGEKAFRETYDSIMKDILTSSESSEENEKVLANA